MIPCKTSVQYQWIETNCLWPEQWEWVWAMLRHYGLNSFRDITVTIKTLLLGATKEKLFPQWAQSANESVNRRYFVSQTNIVPILITSLFSVSRDPCMPLPPLSGEFLGKGQQHELWPESPTWGKRELLQTWKCNMATLWPFPISCLLTAAQLLTEDTLCSHTLPLKNSSQKNWWIE